MGPQCFRSGQIHTHRRDAHGFQALAHLRIGHRFLQGRGQLFHHRLGRALGGIQAKRDVDLKTFDTGLRNCRHIGQLGQAGLTRRRHGLDLAGLDRRHRARCLVTQHIDLTAHQIGQSRAGAFVGNLIELHIQSVHHHQAAQVRSRAHTRMGQADFRAIGFDVVDKLLQVFGRKFVARGNQHRATGGAANGLEIVHRVVRQAFVHRRVGGMAHMDHQQGVAIGLGAGHFGGTDRARCTCGVVHHNLLAQVLLHGARKHAGDGVTRATCGIRHDHGQGAVGEVLRPSLTGRGHQQNGQAAANKTKGHVDLRVIEILEFVHQAKRRSRMSKGSRTCRGSAPPPGMPTCVAFSSMDTIT